MEKRRVVALVPMRHHSQRVPGKNYRLLQGKPLYQHILDTLLRVAEVDQIVVDTDSPEILAGLAQHYPQVVRIERPEALRADSISMNEILIYDTSQVRADLYLQTHSTNPLLKAETISRAINTFQDALPRYDSLFSVTRLQSRLYDEHGHAINHNPAELIQTQDLPPVYEENSCIYLFTRDSLLQHHHRIGEHPCLFEIDPEEAWDIDEEVDFRLVELLMQVKSEGSLPK